MATRDDEVAALRLREPPWDELLERRVLNEVHAQHRRRGDRRHPGRKWGAVAASLLVATSVGAWGLGAFDRTEPDAPSIASAPPVVEPGSTEPAMPPAEKASVMALADGSRVSLDDGAQVEVLLQTDARIDLVHRDGRVRYEIAHDPLRSFVVHAGTYEVRVLGTVFVVEATSERVRVEVERGKVEVIDEGRVLELEMGEQIDLPRREAAEDAREAAAIEPREAAPAKPTSRTPRATVDELLLRADAARRSGRATDAAAALTQLVREHPRDPQAASAWFMLGRVQRGLGRHAEAARAFQGAWKARPSPALAEDARAEEAISWHDAGSTDRAVRAAEAYLARYPAGTHVGRIRTIIER